MQTEDNKAWGGRGWAGADDMSISTVKGDRKSIISKTAISIAHKSHVDSRASRKEESSVIDHLSALYVAPRRDLEAQSLVGSVTTHVDKGFVGTRPEDYSLGDIIRVPHVVPSLDPASKLGDDHVGWTVNTGPVVGKLRPAIVVGVFRYWLTCIPLWTSQGKGMNPAEAENCLWLRQNNDDGSVWKDVPEHRYLMVLPPFQCGNVSYANLTQAYPVSYRYPIKHMGSLTSSSWQRLQKLWTTTTQKGFHKVGEQQAYALQQISMIAATGEFERMHKLWLQQQDRQQGFETVTTRKRARRGSHFQY